MASVTVTPRSRSLKGFSEHLTVLTVGLVIDKLSNASRLNRNRIRLTYKEGNKHIPLDGEKSLPDYFSAEQLKLGVTLYAKDLGPQLGWRTVFILEYLGPLLIHALVYLYYSVVKGVTQSATQKLALWLCLLHFAKREYETVYVHRFSNATMPFFNLFKNSGHYWILSGINLSFFVYSHNATELQQAGFIKRFVFHVNSLPKWANVLLVLLWTYAEVSNFITHKILSGLRSQNSKAYVIPHGYGFSWVACPNYFFESLSWTAFALLVGNWSAWLFLAVSSGQMYLWAIKKHRRYIQTFGDEYKKLKRSVYIPFL